MKLKVVNIHTGVTGEVEFEDDWTPAYAREQVESIEWQNQRFDDPKQLMDYLRSLDTIKIGEDVEDDESDYQPAYYQ